MWSDDEGEDETARIVKGGSYRSFKEELLLVSARLKVAVTESDTSVGFRVVIDPGQKQDQ